MSKSLIELAKQSIVTQDKLKNMLGKKQYKKLLIESQASCMIENNEIPTSVLFELFDTYGIPIEDIEKYNVFKNVMDGRNNKETNNLPQENYLKDKESYDKWCKENPEKYKEWCDRIYVNGETK